MRTWRWLTWGLVLVVMLAALGGCQSRQKSIEPGTFNPTPAETAAPSGPEVALDLALGDAAKLKGYTLDKAADGKTEIVLHWECIGPISTPHSVFLHLYPKDRSLLSPDRAAFGFANLDHDPRVPTVEWQTGRTYLSIHRGQLATGSYRTLAGLYSIRSGTVVRMKPATESEDMPERPALDLAEIAIP